MSVPAIKPSAEFLLRFRETAGNRPTIGFDEFVDLALYDPAVGYYRKPRQRVGFGSGTDFFTATSSGQIFGELICAACRTLVPEQELSAMEFVEIGAEPGAGVLREVIHPFASARTLALGEKLNLSGNLIVFSNELFDAQPFQRWVGTQTGWRERGVAFKDEHFVEVERRETTPHVSQEISNLAPTENYRLDLPIRAKELAETIAKQPWRGLFLAFDYGKTWRDLTENCPSGTARAYYQHTQSNDLLARPGEQDITCHICWDWIFETLRRNRFCDPALNFQETFLVHHAASFIAATMEAEASRLSQRKLALMQLLHPAHLGQKFQVMHAWRDA